MSALATFISKESREIARTWRLPVFFGLIGFFALTGPLLALYTPELLESLTTQQPGVVIQIPDPTWRDAYLQWTGNLSEIVAFVTLIVGAGVVSSEIASGTAILVLTKPVSRVAFVLAKALALFGLVALAVVGGALVTQAVTFAVFGEAPSADLWEPTLLWLAFAAVLVSLSTMLSALMPTLAAAGTGIAAFLLMSGLGLLEPVERYSPVGLMAMASRVVMGEDPEIFWPLVTAAVLSVVLLGIACAAFSRREL